MKDIYRYARYFINVALLQEEDQDILEVLNDISTLKVDVAYPFLLEVYDDYANQRLAKKDFISLLRLVESYVFRRLICGVPTNGLNKVFVTLAKDIDKTHYLESVQAIFLAKTRGIRKKAFTCIDWLTVTGFNMVTARKPGGLSPGSGQANGPERNSVRMKCL